MQVLGILKDKGYDGWVTLEFEGCEEPKKACEWGLNTLRKINELLGE